MNDLLSYPDTLPREAWQIILDALRGELPDARHANHVAWHAYGYFSGKMFSDGPFGEGGPPSPPEESHQAYLHRVCEAQLAGALAAGRIDWKKLMEALLKVVLPLIITVL